MKSDREVPERGAAVVSQILTCSTGYWGCRRHNHRHTPKWISGVRAGGEGEYPEYVGEGGGGGGGLVNIRGTWGWILRIKGNIYLGCEDTDLFIGYLIVVDNINITIVYLLIINNIIHLCNITLCYVIPTPIITKKKPPTDLKYPGYTNDRI